MWARRVQAKSFKRKEKPVEYKQGLEADVAIRYV